MSSFSVNAKPGTDIWRKPPHTDVWNAPSATPAGAITTGPLTKFKSAQMSFSLPAKEQYDQGGILLSLQRAGSPVTPPPKWIKSGVEYYNSVPKLGTVGCDSWADWSLSPVLGDGKWVTVAIEKGGDEHGISLWVYQIVDGEKIPLREICWVFGDSPESWEISVSAYAARPKGETEELVVEFKDFEVQWSS